eukprot:843723_1
MSAFWTTGSLFILVTVIAVAMLLPISVIHYKKNIEPYRHLSCWKVRRPSYLLFWLILSIVSDVMNNAVRLMLHLHLLNESTQYIITVFLQYYGASTFGLVRVLLLVYDLKYCRQQQHALLSRSLDSDTDAYASPLATSKKYNSGSAKAVALRIVVIVTPFCVFTIAIGLAGYIQASKMLLFLYTILVIIWFGYLLFSTSCHCRCCCFDPIKLKFKSSPFRDDWSVLFELTVLWCIWIVTFVVSFMVTLRIEHFDGVVWISCIMAISRCVIILWTFVVPYKTTKKITHINKYKKASFKRLKKVLSRKSTFFAFVEHLVHEFSIENLTFLVEVWQYKYEEKYNLKPGKNGDKTLPKQKTCLDIDGNENRWLDEVSKTKDEPSVGSMYSQSETRADEVWAEFAAAFVSELPWSELPLAHSIASNLKDKWNQCGAVFVKFVGVDGSGAINIGYKARNEIYYKYTLLKRYKESEKEILPSLELNRVQNSNNPVEVMMQMDIMDVDRISTQQQFDAILSGVFDAALHDVLDNLVDSLHRFVRTEQYKVAH